MTFSSIGGRAAVASALLAFGCKAGSERGTAQANIAIDSATRFQTIVGWESTAQAGQEEPGFARFKDSVLSVAVDDLGINRVRLEVGAGAENTTDYWSLHKSGAINEKAWRCSRYATINDDADPNHINESGFQWARLDQTTERVVLPLKRRVEANGEKLYLNLNYVAFTNSICAGDSYAHQDPEEYAEFVLAAVTHLKTKYNLVPDALEIILEPDKSSHWSNGTIVGRAIVAATRRLRANGFALEIIAPSTTNMRNVVPYLDAMAAVPGALEQLTELSYHRYGGVSESNLRAIAAAAKRRGLRTAMLEHIGSGHEDLY
ncbi:MAG: hypothetical protein LC775_08280, partial [Acidobacteria bacterium]|nr:hypothetical protein [Acidobacteriota bacterium]